MKTKSIDLVERWIDRAKALHAAQDAISDIMMASPEAPIFTASWDVLGGYTELLAKALGDEGGWLEWFLWDCNLGDNPMEMTFPNGKKLTVLGAAELVDVIHQ